MTASQVDRDRASGHRLVLGVDRPGVHDPGVVDEHVERAEAVLDAVEERGERRVVGHVDADAEGVPAELGGHLVGEIAVEIADRDPGALTRQRLSRRVADAARPTGDRDDLVGQRARPTSLRLRMVWHACGIYATSRWRTRNSVWSRTACSNGSPR